jgi:hypothetical protein
MTSSLAVATKGFWPATTSTSTVYYPLNGTVTTNSKEGTVVLS